MRKFLFLLGGLLILPVLMEASSYSFSDPKKDTATKIRIVSIGAGYIKTSLNFFKNANENTYSNGYGIRVAFQPSEVFRMAACFSQAESVTIDPTWVNVNNSFYDLEAHFMMHFSDVRNIAYFIIGASAQYWNGFYTGVHDLNNWKLNIPANTQYHSLYFGGKMGMGAEIKLFGPISGYGEFIFRVTKTDVGAGLSDVVYGLGVKVNVANLHRGKKGHHHSILRFKDKYHWF